MINTLIALGVPSGRAAHEAASLSQSQGGHGSVASIPAFVRLDFAYSARTVLYVMAGIMAVAAVVALIGLRDGVQEEAETPGAGPAVSPQSPSAETSTAPNSPAPAAEPAAPQTDERAGP